MDEQHKITIIEGPTPVFEMTTQEWALGLVESAKPHHVVQTSLRALNGYALVERCHRAWRQAENIYLHYRDESGLERYAPIIAAKNTQVPEGDVLILWIDLDPSEFEVETDNSDEEDFGDELDL